jgi:hypothetical protein
MGKRANKTLLLITAHMAVRYSKPDRNIRDKLILMEKLIVDIFDLELACLGS